MQIGIASRPKPGEIECGDQCAVVENGEKMLIVVADGLGHGSQAAKAAKAACRFVEENSDKELERLIISCSKAIADTRGAAMSLLRIEKSSRESSYGGVGNVDVRIKTENPVAAINTPGIIGRRIARVKISSFRLEDGDLLVLHSDGISSRFSLDSYKQLDAQGIADSMLSNFALEHDDATCVVIRY